MTAVGALDPYAWYPIARSDDVVPGHVYFGQLFGQELAVWRADDDWVNVWENRCLHRGVRLTIGLNEGRELRCQYHGWRYANRTAGCTYIPAHPADAPARTICNRTFAVHEIHGMVWTSLEASGKIERASRHRRVEQATLSAQPADRRACRRCARRTGRLLVPPGGPRRRSECCVRGRSGRVGTRLVGVGRDARPRRNTGARGHRDPLRSAGRLRATVVRSLLADLPPSADRLALWHDHNRALIAVRDRAENIAARMPAPAPMRPPIRAVPVELASIPERRVGRHSALRVMVARKWMTADGIAGFELTPLDGQLPTCQPGAHIDVHLPNGLVRQYSLTNGPGELDRYVIGVKREPESRGGSAALHDSVREGDVLAVSEPRNNFPLRRDSFHTVLIAGGIGIAPLLSMAQALHQSRLSFDLHYFVQSPDHVAFREILDSLGRSVHLHLGLSPHETTNVLGDLLATPGTGVHTYVCGPGPMLDAARGIATAIGWDDDAVHFEYFANTTEIDSSSTFEIELARSAVTLPRRSGADDRRRAAHRWGGGDHVM